MQGNPAQANPTLPGAEHRGRIRLSVAAILGSEAPPVESKGSQFFNRDRWTLRVFVEKMCEWAKANPECVPTRDIIADWVYKANNDPIPERVIRVANTPDKLTQRTALALIGGAYHEAGHTYYSCRRKLRTDEMHAMIAPRWAKVPDWSKFYVLLQQWNNIVEDIRIERLGCAEFPGIRTKMCDLQDFILAHEAEGLSNLRAHGNPQAERGALSIIMTTFRDVGLGYSTIRQRQALEEYKAENSDAVLFVVGEGKGNPGPLTGLLKESIALTRADDTGCVRVALDVIGMLYAHGNVPDPANDPANQEHQPGEAQGKCECPSCQAPAEKLVIRPMSNGRGGKVKGKGVLTCTVCGHQEEIDIKPPSKSKAGKGGEPPRFEGFDLPKPQDGEDGQGAGADGDEGEGEDGQNAGADGDGQDAGGDGGEGGRAPSETPRDEGQGEGENEQNGGESPGGQEGGGHNYEAGPVAGNDWSDLANEAMSQAGQGAQLKDNNSALEEAVAAESEKENRREGGVRNGEAPWNPYDPEGDMFELVQPSRRGKEHDRMMANRLYASVKRESSALRARFRQIFRANEMTGVVHGIRKGRRLSPRYLTDTRVSLMGREPPRRAYKEATPKQDMSTRAAVVVDESGSMASLLKLATQLMCVITEPFDALGCPVQVSGFRDGPGYSYPDRGDPGVYHRTNAVVHDIFKRFDEPLRAVKWRFANTRATGGTPMADGVQFGLDSLLNHTETHRVLFILTDGMPNGGHLPVIRRQLRLAKQAGIVVVGVGIGRGAEYVKTVFPDSVWEEKVSDMPRSLFIKLNELIDKRGGRGR